MTRRVFWAACWLAVGLVAVKAYYLGVPTSVTRLPEYLNSLTAISSADVMFAAIVWGVGRALLGVTGGRVIPGRAIAVLVMSVAALSCLYAVLNVVLFGVLGGFVTYPLLELIGNVRMIGSSVSANLTSGVLIALIALPLGHVALVEATVRLVPVRLRNRNLPRLVAAGCCVAWILVGSVAFSEGWATRQDRHIAQNSQWVFFNSWWQAVSGTGVAHMAESFPPEDLKDFEPFGLRPPVVEPVVRRVSNRRMFAPLPRRPLNVVVLVLESVAARWTGLSGGVYDTTPNLKAESNRAVVFDQFYAHIGRSSNSLAAMLLSLYPKLDFRDFTEEFMHPPANPLPAAFQQRGYRTAFMMPSDMSWAEWGTFLQGAGFDDLKDSHQLACSPPISSWGVEDRCLVDGMLEWLGRDTKRPFFLVGWTVQTHHPYEPSPGIPLLNLLREPSPDDYDLGRYLNVMHETDRHVERLFNAIRSAGLEQDTMVVVVGDHGQAFGVPHDTYIQGRTLYEEDVHVPLMFWLPRRFAAPERSQVIGAHVDLAPTIAELAGLSPAPDWQGRSLFDASRPPRAYFYVAEDHFALGVREGAWKYTFDMREGIEELYDLDHDPLEQHNLAATEGTRSARLRQRLAAWTESNRRHYESVGAPQVVSATIRDDVKPAPALSAR